MSKETRQRYAGQMGETWSMRQGRLNALERQKILEAKSSKLVRTLTPEQRAAKQERDRARRQKQKESNYMAARKGAGDRSTTPEVKKAVRRKPAARQSKGVVPQVKVHDVRFKEIDDKLFARLGTLIDQAPPTVEGLAALVAVRQQLGYCLSAFS